MQTKMKYLSGVFLMVALANALPTPPVSNSSTLCEPPKQFVGRHGVVITYFSGKKSVRGDGFFYYDRDTRRQRVDHVSKGINYTIVQEYNKGVQYKMFKKGGNETCVREPVERVPLRIPPGSVEIQRGRIGTKQHGFDVRRFYGSQEETNVLATVTADGCIWVSSLTAFPKDGLIIFFSVDNISRLNVTEADFAHPPDPDCPFEASHGGRELPSNKHMFFQMVFMFLFLFSK